MPQSEARAELPACGPAKMAEILAPATTVSPAVYVDCDVVLQPNDVVTKRLVLEGESASDATIDCQGAHIDGGPGTVNAGAAMLEIRSRRIDDRTWQRPENIRVSRCRITGGVRVWGMSRNGEGADLRASSRAPDAPMRHVARARAAAPAHVLLEDLVVEGVGQVPLYIGPGVSHVTLIDSAIGGFSRGPAVYLDAESTSHLIKNNSIYTDTRGRELVAVDGSDWNRIVGNRFASLENGGIYLYRNCGEGGTVRITTPSHNQIINNTFFYRRYNGRNAAVLLGARNGNRSYCRADESSEGRESNASYGSRGDNRDFARFNVVAHNRIVATASRRRAGPRIVTRWPDANSPNLVEANETVVATPPRRSGCYVPDAVGRRVVGDGERVDVFADALGRPSCRGHGYVCDDNELVPIESECAFETVRFECRVEGNDAGCTTYASCPPGRRIVSAVAACNLEHGSVTEAQLSRVPGGMVTVVRASDRATDGLCSVGDDGTHDGSARIASAIGASGTDASCSEHDRNGGDCHVVGSLFCL